MLRAHSRVAIRAQLSRIVAHARRVRRVQRALPALHAPLVQRVQPVRLAHLILVAVCAVVHRRCTATRARRYQAWR